jgi:hypothetical protein
MLEKSEYRVNAESFDPDFSTASPYIKGYFIPAAHTT